jgi:hypothetical protein
LQANSWTNNQQIDSLTHKWSPTPLNWRNTNQYTLSYGGPIIKGKTFFFALWDQNMSVTKQIVTTPVLTDAARQGIYRYFDNWISADADQLPPTFPANAATVTVPHTREACGVSASLETPKTMAVRLRQQIVLAASP